MVNVRLMLEVATAITGPTLPQRDNGGLSSRMSRNASASTTHMYGENVCAAPTPTHGARCNTSQCAELLRDNPNAYTSPPACLRFPEYPSNTGPPAHPTPSAQKRQGLLETPSNASQPARKRQGGAAAAVAAACDDKPPPQQPQRDAGPTRNSARTTCSCSAFRTCVLMAEKLARSRAPGGGEAIHVHATLLPYTPVPGSEVLRVPGTGTTLGPGQVHSWAGAGTGATAVNATACTRGRRPQRRGRRGRRLARTYAGRRGGVRGPLFHIHNRAH